MNSLISQKRINTIAVCAPQVPFRRGGAEEHVDSLVRELKKREFNVELIQLPYKWYPHESLFRSIQMWEMLDLTESDGEKIDMIITTKFPSYFAKHPNRVLWLIHQYRQAYDLFNTPFSSFDPKNKKDLKARDRLIKLDTNELKNYDRIYTNSINTSIRLEKYNSLSSIPLYHPPKLKNRFFNAGYDNYILSIGRLDSLKRIDKLIKSLAHCAPCIKCKIVGSGPDLERLENITKDSNVSDRVEFLGRVSDDRLLDLYARCNLVFFAPIDEDYGYITLEAFLSKKPVITSFDSGGTLEFVEDNKNGYILKSLDEQYLAKKIEELFFNVGKCKEFGENGFQKVKHINWDSVIETLINEK